MCEWECVEDRRSRVDSAQGYSLQLRDAWECQQLAEAQHAREKIKEVYEEERKGCI